MPVLVQHSVPRTLFSMALPMLPGTFAMTTYNLVDEGGYNIGVRPTAEDLGRGGITPKVDPDVDSVLPPARSLPPLRPFLNMDPFSE